jgi:hypothetical protein
MVENENINELQLALKSVHTESEKKKENNIKIEMKELYRIYFL